MALVGDPTLPAGWRIDYLGAAWVGARDNTREVLLGVDASSAARDIPEASEIARMARDDWEAVPGIGEPSRGALDRLRHLLPWNVVTSLSVCVSVQ